MLRIVLLGRVGLGGVVVDGADDDASCPWSGVLQRGPLEVAFGVPRLHICHLAGVSGRNPLRKIFELVELTNRSNASQVETGVVGRFLHDVRDLRDCRHGIVEVHYDLPCR